MLAAICGPAAWRRPVLAAAKAAKCPCACQRATGSEPLCSSNFGVTVAQRRMRSLLGLLMLLHSSL